jgi:hypothetical protein
LLPGRAPQAERSSALRPPRGDVPDRLEKAAVVEPDPGIADDYRATFRRLDDLVPDIWLTHHNEIDDFGRRRDRAAMRGAPAWVNRDTSFEAEFARQRRRAFAHP